MPNEFIIRNGLIVESGTTTVTGSITATGGFTGSLLGTASVATSLAGGALTNFIEGFSSATQATSFLSASNAAATVNIAIVAKGSGSILAQVPTGTTVGGNARGAYSVDFQTNRFAASQVAISPRSFLGNGSFNTVNDIQGNGHSAIVCGESNSTSRGWCFIGSGLSNSTGQDNAFIGAGRSNSATGVYSGIGSGYLNTANNESAFVGGGQSNTAGNQWAFVGGGRQNSAAGQYSKIGGGYANTITSNGYTSTIGGGISNYIDCVGTGGNTIGGGESNSLAGTDNTAHRTIGGGTRNTINANQTVGATICGGIGNTIYFGSAGSIICGGGYAAFPGGNFLTGTNSAIVGGQNNRIGSSSPINYATYCFIGGGGANTIGAESDYSVITGGAENTINGTIDYAIITGGYQGVASLYGQQVHASGRFAANGDAQAHELIWRRLITGTSPTELFLDGSSVRAVLPATNTIWRGVVDIAAVCTNAGGGTTVVGDVAAGSYEVTIKRLNTNTVLVGAVQIIGTLDTDTSMSTANFTIAADNTNEALAITFTPPSTADGTTTFRVVATFRGLQIRY